MGLFFALKRAAAIEYAVVRTSLHFADDRLLRRYLDESSAVRKSFERALQVLDDVGDWFSAEPTPGGPSPAPSGLADLSVEEVEQIDQLANDMLERQEPETFTGELAEDDELRRIQAELKAKHLVEERED